jgi:hypothetical protein
MWLKFLQEEIIQNAMKTDKRNIRKTAKAIKQFVKTFIRFSDIKYPSDYLPDLIHLKDSGNDSKGMIKYL